MRPSTLCAASLLAAATAAAAAEPVDWEMVTRIRDEGLKRSQVMKTLRHLTDGIGPRLTGSPALRQANEWTRDQLSQWGLENAKLEEWGPFGRGWSFSRASVHMLTPRATPLHALPKAWTPGTEGPVSGPVARVKIESEADFEKYRGRLAGYVVLLDEPRAVDSGAEPAVDRETPEELEKLEQFEIRTGGDPRADFVRRRAERWKLERALNAFLKSEGVLAAISVSARDSGLIHVSGGGSREPGEDPGVPALVMATEHYDLVHRLIAPPDGAETTPVEIEVDVRARFHDETTSAWNTLAEIPGRDPDAGVVMLGAHLDSWHSGTGATDNGAGSAVVMEAVRILKAIGARPRRTVRVALWTGEEQGLLGSRAYVERHFADVSYTKVDGPSWMRSPVGRPVPKPEHAGLAAYFNLDNGSGRIRGVYTQGNAAVVPIFRAWLEPFHDLGADTLTQRDTGGTDHLGFDAVGLPGFQFIQDRLDYGTRTHHTDADTYDHARAEDLMQASVIMASFAWHAAERAERLPREPMPEYPAPSAEKTEEQAGEKDGGDGAR